VATLLGVALAVAACGRYGPPVRAPLAVKPSASTATPQAQPPPAAAAPTTGAAQGPATAPDLGDEDEDSEPPPEPHR
jgi:hypothetical protein